ncbi:MAG: DUF115 domain-containing protein [Leptospirales bacterium]|nr:DUF115 domain-containing protein [Leptospirales bacterium]
MIKKDISYRVEPAKNGDMTLIVNRVNKERKDIPLHSRMNPLKEGDASNYNLNPEKFDLLIVIGCGLGYSLIKSQEEIKRYRHIVIIDILYNIENEIIKNPHTAFLVEDENVRFLTGLDLDEIHGILSQIIDFDEYKGIQTIEHHQSLRFMPDYYDSIKSIIKSIIDKKAGNQATIRAFGNVFIRNAINNINNLSKCKYVSDLAGKFKGRKAVIVSSAPSLEDHIESLKFYQDSLYIIAVDSALSVLRCFDIRPDFVISIDPQGRIGEHFLGHELFDSIHVFSIVSPPELVERYNGFISLNSHPVSQIIAEMFNGAGSVHTTGSVQGVKLESNSIDSATGSVSGDAFMLALICGFEYVAMLGFDFSFSNNIIYAKNTSYQNRYANFFNNRFKTPETFNASYIFKSSRALIVEERYTRRAFVNYRDSLNNLIKEKNYESIYSINKRGLKLTISKNIDFDTFMELPSYLTSYDENKNENENDNKNENKSEYIRKINSEKSISTFNIKMVKDKLLEEKVFNDIIEASLGTDLSVSMKNKIIALIENI